MDLKRKEIEKLIHRTKALLHTYELLQDTVPEIEVVNDRLVVICDTMEQVFDAAARITEAIGWSSNKTFTWQVEGKFITSFKDDRNELVEIWLR